MDKIYTNNIFSGNPPSGMSDWISSLMAIGFASIRDSFKPLMLIERHA